MSKLVSVLIPAYNVARLLPETLASVAAQTWPNLETIVVDDGSTDDAGAAVRPFVSNRLRFVRQEKQGAASARNTALLLAQGDYLQFLDADDLLAPDKIARQVEQLEREPEAVASSRWGKFERDIAEARFRPEPVWKSMAGLEWIVRAALFGGMMPTSCWLVPRGLAEKAGPWDVTCRVSANDDGEYFTRVLLKSAGVIFVEKAVTYYREVPGSLSKNMTLEAMAAFLHSYDRIRAEVLSVADTAETRKAIVALYATFLYKAAGDYPELSRRAWKAVEELGGLSRETLPPTNVRRVAAFTGSRTALRLSTWLRGRHRRAAG